MLAADKEIESRQGTHFCDQRQVRRQEGTLRKVEQDDISLGGNEGGTPHVVHDPHLHVCRIQGVANVERIGQQAGWQVARFHFRAHASKAILSHRLQVRRL